jgi:hypothetical protein
MMLIWGRYFFGKTRVGVKRDYCNGCKSEVVAMQVRTFDMLHLFFIPLIPLGFVKRWYCTQCGLDPRVRFGVSSGVIKFALAAAGLVLALASYGIWSVTLGPDDPILLTYALRLVLPAGLAALIYYGFIRKPTRPSDPNNERLRMAVVPLDTNECYFCHTPLPKGFVHPVCTGCGVQTFTDVQVK